jgi:uncharacterized membrane protein YgcG
MSQQRYEKEIEEILKNSGANPPEQPSDEPPEPSRRRRRTSSVRRISLRGAAISYKGVLLAGITLLVISAIFGGLYLFLAGVALLVAGYVMYYRAPRSGGSSGGGSSGGGSSGGGSSAAPKMWRGRSIDPDDDPHFTNDRWGRRR